MIWRDRKSHSIGHLGRLLAVFAVFAWSLATSVCPAAAGAEINHEHVSTDSHSHGAPQPDDLDACCRYLSNTAAIVASPSLLPSIKAVVSIAAKPLPLVVGFVAIANSKPARVSTGPPQSRSIRLTTYSSLAPPSEHV